MEYIIIAMVAGGASLLTFFSGFGLGTLLLPAFALFVPVESAVAFTAIVHFLNNLFKFGIVSRVVSWKVAAQFGIPALVAAFFGATTLGWLAAKDIEPFFRYHAFGRDIAVYPVNIAIGTLIAFFAIMELAPRTRALKIDRKFLFLGGLISGFFGGFSGHQGALRTPFLLRCGLSKESFIATGIAAALLVDIGRIAQYQRLALTDGLGSSAPLVLTALGAAFFGAFFGRRFLKTVSMRVIRILVFLLLVAIAFGVGSGIIA